MFSLDQGPQGGISFWRQVKLHPARGRQMNWILVSQADGSVAYKQPEPLVSGSGPYAEFAAVVGPTRLYQ